MSLSRIILLFAGIYISCGDPPSAVLVAPLPVEQQTVPSTELKIEEVILDPMIIVGHGTVENSSTMPELQDFTSESGDIVLDETPITGAVLQIVSDDSEDEACKKAGDFLVVPVLPAAGTYSDCKDLQNSLYTMKVVNCSKSDITFTMFNFTLSLYRVEELKGFLKGGLELFTASNFLHTIGVFEIIDDKSVTLSFPLEGTVLTIAAGQEEYCELRVSRPCLTGDHPPQFSLDLTGAWASKGDNEDEYVSGAVFERPDRLVTFMSRD